MAWRRPGVAPSGRLGFVVLSLFDGLGLAVYLAGFLLLPAGPDGPARLLRRILGVAIVPAWLLIAVADGRWKIPDGSLGLALLLVGVALSLWSPGAPAAGGATSGSRPGGG